MILMKETIERLQIKSSQPTAEAMDMFVGLLLSWLESHRCKNKRERSQPNVVIKRRKSKANDTILLIPFQPS